MSGNDKKPLETSEKSFRFLFGTTRPLVQDQSLEPENLLKLWDFSGFSMKIVRFLKMLFFAY